jgi:hypothetical protein
MQISAVNIALGKARHLNIDSDYAYLVTPATLAYTKAGKPVAEKAVVTMSFAAACASRPSNQVPRARL